MRKRFEDKVIIITGAGMGIGRASSLAFAREGGSVAVVDISEPDGNEVVTQIQDEGGKAVFIHCDVANSKDVQRMVAETVSAFGGVDVLYNNAGVVRYGTVVDMSEEEWDYILNVNLRATFLTCKYTIPEMRKRGGGVIVNTSSVQAFASQRTVAAYSASKGGVLSLTKTVALDHVDENIRCNCIAPASIHTPMLEWGAAMFVPDDPAQAIKEWGELHPMGRVGTPEEVANMVMFLASDESSFSTGSCFFIDGGLLASAL
ncbi:MAG: glucose 1-dehydrogenase [Chloroflexi bacterium]|nr:glucose 1-dehydrogenase [Chloroflexota bacterium]